MEHSIDRLTRTRRKWWPLIGDVKERVFDGYGEYTLSPDERVGVVDKPVQDVAELLRDMGFHREPVAALKKRESGEASAGSWKYIPDSEKEYQLHVTLFALDEGTEINAHYEVRWEPWAPEWDMSRPKRHYRPNEDGGYYDIDEGVERMTQLLEEYNVNYEEDSN